MAFPAKDIDLYFDSSNENVKRIINSLVRFGFPEKDLSFYMFTSEGNIITFGVEPVRVDFLNQISGVDFKEDWQIVFNPLGPLLECC